MCIHTYMYASTHTKTDTYISRMKISSNLVFADRYIISLQNYICGSGTALEVTLKTET